MKLVSSLNVGTEPLIKPAVLWAGVVGCVQ